MNGSIAIRKVEKDTQLLADLIKFVEKGSWEEVKEHLLNSLREFVFTDWETMFAAMDGDRIVGHASLLKTDYYPLPEIYPWVSTIFVTEDHRGRMISGQLIDAANEYAKSLGFVRTYIPSEYMGLYEHYGYRYLRDIVNYGGGTDHLFVKDLYPLDLRYKKATLEDLDFLVESRVEVLRAANELSADTDMSVVEGTSREYYSHALADGTHTAYLVYNGDEFVGAGGVSYYQVMPTYHGPSGWKAYIMNMYVKPEYRRQGIALKTLDLLVQDAKEKGVDAITLEATRMGRPLYEAYGFVPMENEMELV